MTVCVQDWVATTPYAMDWQKVIVEYSEMTPLRWSSLSDLGCRRDEALAVTDWEPKTKTCAQQNEAWLPSQFAQFGAAQHEAKRYHRPQVLMSKRTRGPPDEVARRAVMIFAHCRPQMRLSLHEQ